MRRFSRIQRKYTSLGAVGWEVEYIAHRAIATALGFFDDSFVLPNTPKAWHLYERREAATVAVILSQTLMRMIEDLRPIAASNPEVVRNKLWRAL